MQPVTVGIDNDDDRYHQVTVSSWVMHEQIDATQIELAPGESWDVEIDVDPTRQTEIVVEPDTQGHALVNQSVTAQAPDFGEINPATAVSIFSIVSGIGGAASQLLASQRVADQPAVPVSRVGTAAGLSIIGSVAATLLL